METTVSQQRSRFALDQLESTRVNKEFATLTAGLPAMILGNGFGHALAFLIAKATDKNGKFNKQDRHYVAFTIIAQWLKKMDLIKEIEPKVFLKALSAMSQDQYMQAQEEALLILEWVKRYANSGLFLKDEGDFS